MQNLKIQVISWKWKIYFSKNAQKPFSDNWKHIYWVGIVILSDFTISNSGSNLDLGSNLGSNLG